MGEGPDISRDHKMIQMWFMDYSFDGRSVSLEIYIDGGAFLNLSSFMVVTSLGWLFEVCQLLRNSSLSMRISDCHTGYKFHEMGQYPGFRNLCDTYIP